uniref:Erbb2 interacting protein n=1 Tax=Oncorhynchus mykiss TaxID=8022 RepID=A0A8C7TF98_ONCMY
MSSKRNLFVRLVPCRCLRGEEEAVTSLDYSHCSLETVPKEIFSLEKTLEELYLDANQIEELPKQLFNCQLLHRLSMPDNDLTVLPAAIANLVNLRELDVSKNSIQEFPENIKNCKVLAIVEASVNPISKLPEGFTQLLSLSQLYLNDAFLEFLPASFALISLPFCPSLCVSRSPHSFFPSTLCLTVSPDSLSLSCPYPQPEVLEQLTGIKELWMDGNRLTFLPGRLGTLKQLSYLDVSKNNLEMVDEQICGCESLQDLLLSNNALTQLPGSIGSLKKLTALKVDENQLMYLPDSVGGLAALDELDCSFNEIEALPSSIGQCVSIRTFAADHNFLTQLVGLCYYVHAVLCGDFNCNSFSVCVSRLRNLPYSFTKLNQMTAMWLSENQSKPLIPLQKEEDQETHKTVLTNYMFPQQTRTEDCDSDSESFNPSLWEEQRKQRAQVAFECDEDKDERETPPREGNLKRYPTPYPDELKNMVKTAQSVAHRLKEDESGNESGKDARPSERNHVGVQDVGVKVIEAPCANGKPVEMEPKAPVCIQDSTAPLETSESYNSQKTSLRTSDNTRTMNHEDTLEDSEELSSEEEEMKMAEMRPPLIEITINQPKVVALSKNKKDDGKDADSLLDETVANSNQNNSNCSSPSRMSDSVSLTTDSSQDNSLCTPEREAKMPFLPKSRQEDVNMNQRKESTPLLQNGNGSATSLQALLKTQQGYESKPEKMVVDYDLSMERLAFIEKGNNNGMGDAYTKWDQINMNLAKLPPHPDNMVVQPDDRPNGSSAKEDFNHLPPPYNNDNSTAPITDHLKNGNQLGDHFNSHSSEGLAVSPMRVDSATSMVRTASAGVTASSNMSLSRSTEELSPEKRCSPPVVAKAQSITNIEAGGMKLYSLDAEGGSYEGGVVGRMAGAGPGAQGQSIVRSKSASLLNDQPFQVYSGSSASSSDLLSSSSKPPVSTGRYPVPSGMAMGPPPQYNVQYSSSTMPKDGLWTQRTPVLPDQGFLPPPQHSLANTNYSNRNQAPPYLLQAQQRGPPTGPTPGDMWAKERHLSLGGQPRSGTLQRQSSSSSSMGDPRRMQVPEGEYMTYRDIHTLGRGPLAVAQAMQRPLSARTYSIDGPSTPRPQSSRPQPHELPERTMSVSDFNYQHVSPSKRPNARVKSEHSLLDGPGGPGAGGRVPVDWRDQVMRHIEAKKMEKNALSRSYNSNCAPLSCSHYGSSRDVHHSGSQGSLVFSAAADGRPYGDMGFVTNHLTWFPLQDDVFGPQGQQGYTMDTLRQVSVPSLNGQLGGPVRGQMTSCQTPMARHPSREQLIDYLMLKVSHGQQPLGPPPPRADHDTLQQEFRVKVEKNPELGFSISGGVGGRGNPFRPDDNGIFVTRVQPEGPASKILQPGDKILQANGYSFVNVDHGNAVALLKTFPTTVDMIIVRELAA